MLSIFAKIFDSNAREVNKLKPLVEEINSWEPKIKKLSDNALKKKKEEFISRIKNKGATLDSLLPEVYAYVREASRRVLNQRHFDVQLMAGIALHQGKIAEQKTGEGKTLTATLPLYLNSLTGKGVHLVTVNDYLARRDAGWMGPVFYALGATVSAIINDAQFIYDPDFNNEELNDERLKHLRPVTRKEAYLADITYGINSEFGFDYLRDNMATTPDELVQRGFYFSIVDEVDSVLIDEARTPHVISVPDNEAPRKYSKYAEIVKKLTSGLDFVLDEKLRTISLTDHGVMKIEKLLGIENIYEKDFSAVHHIEAALKAENLFRKEKDYIVRGDEVMIVDEFTGRILEGRRFSEGIHQAIEAKEGVSVQAESKTLATISLQNYFRQYEKLAGMTGTAVTEAEEFHKIYKLETIVIPTHRNLIRKDKSDMVYKTAKAKYSAVVKQVEECYAKGQPVLIGTTSIEKNEIVSSLLKYKQISHNVLNAKNHLKEAHIIEQAGKFKAVTVATNMAGRGVDIVLDEDAKAAGGLFVMGTERHESRRIDNQLRGRSGRQGDPGTTRFFVSLEDEMLRIFGGDQVANLMSVFKMPEEIPLSHPMVNKAIEGAQVKVEGFHFDSRKHLVEYDDVMNQQRGIVYSLRRRFLGVDENSKPVENANLKEYVEEQINNEIESVVTVYQGNGYTEEEKKQIIDEFATIIPFDDASKREIYKQIENAYSREEIVDLFKKIALDAYTHREKEMGEEISRDIEKFVCLQVVDNLWTDHLEAIDDLREGIGLRGYAQRDPLVEYKTEAFNMFERFMEGIKSEVAHRIYKIQVVQNPQIQRPKNLMTNAGQIASAIGDNTASLNKSAPIKTSEDHKLGRNDPCWCGSGKKFKRCHYPNLS
jgi:preprotein translocase subunit SecA